jgi:hypothetical protein
LKWRKQYGNVYTFWQGRKPIIFITEFQLINDMFVKDSENYVRRGVEEEFLVQVQGKILMSLGKCDILEKLSGNQKIVQLRKCCPVNTKL